MYICIVWKLYVHNEVFLNKSTVSKLYEKEMYYIDMLIVFKCVSFSDYTLIRKS